MKRAPQAFDALETRLATNIESARLSHGGRMLWFISAKGFSQSGRGHTAAAAAADFLVRNHLESAEHD